MPEYYDDNFGHWEGMDDEYMVDFYHKVQAESVLKNCVVCGRAVKLRPHYDKCDSCCRKIESGLDVEYCDEKDYEPLITNNDGDE